MTKQVEWRKYESNQISFMADWGVITYQTLKYNIKRLDVISPSIHMVKNKKILINRFLELDTLLKLLSRLRRNMEEC